MLKRICLLPSEEATKLQKHLLRKGIITYAFNNNALNRHFIKMINKAYSSIN